MGKFGVEDGVDYFLLGKSGSGSACASLPGRFSNQLRELVGLSLQCWQVCWILLHGSL